MTTNETRRRSLRITLAITRSALLRAALASAATGTLALPAAAQQAPGGDIAVDQP